MALPIRASDPRQYTDEMADLSPCPCVEVVVRLSVEDADRLAAHRVSRLPSDILAAEAREVAEPVLDALVEAGFGQE